MIDVILKCKKTQFIDEAHAQFYIDKLNRTSKKRTKPTSSYLCPKCFAWHLTSAPLIKIEPTVIVKYVSDEYNEKLIAMTKEAEKWKRLHDRQCTKLANFKIDYGQLKLQNANLRELNEKLDLNK